MRLIVPRVVFWGITVLLFFTPCQPLNASEKLENAYADLVTFGAWGKRRDEHKAQIALLKQRFAEELARTEVIAKANIATARLEEKLLFALDVQYRAQKILLTIGMVDFVVAQLREVITNRFKVNSKLVHFEKWFDSFSTGTGQEIQHLASIIKALNVDDEESLKEALDATRLNAAIRQRSIDDAKTYLNQAINESNWETVGKSVSLIIEIRQNLVELLEHNRATITSLVAEMQAQDVVRRELCKIDTVGVTCDTAGKNCQYYAAVPTDPCKGIRYINVYPVEPIKQVIDQIDEYSDNAIFFIDLTRINEEGPITQDAYASPTDIFGKRLLPASLVPPRFSRSTQCEAAPELVTRLNEGLDYIAIFTEDGELSQKQRGHLTKLLALRPLIDFTAEGLLQDTHGQSTCHPVAPSTARKIVLLQDAIAAVESFGNALTFANSKVLEDDSIPKRVENFANEF